MHTRDLVLVVCLFALPICATVAEAQQPAPASDTTALTIYNDNFAVARTTVDLNLHPGVNDVTTTQVTTQLEPDSVVLRNASRQGQPFRILEQNYDAGVVTQEWLLQKFEGKTIEFEITGPQSVAPAGATKPEIVPARTIPGKILRAGGASGQPLIEVNGQMQFQMPGLPLFPADTDGLLLKPALHWQIQSEKTQVVPAELAYVTGGISWQATYNVIAPDATDVTADQQADVIGWITINNTTGTDFPSARIKLMAGDVAKIQPEANRYVRNRQIMMAAQSVMVEPDVTQKSFDDFHLYDLHRTVQLRNGEIKQVQFLEASGVTLARSYIYDGGAINVQPYYGNRINEDQDFGVDDSNTKVVVQQEFKNSTANHLGIPLPSGRLRLYRRDSDGQMEFVGESVIPHTPTEDTVKLVTGNAFDVKGKRTQTDFHMNQNGHTLDETFQIKVTNQKSQPVTVTAIEHLYRGNNWEITEKSSAFTKVDSHTLKFPIQVPAKGESTLNYSVRYTW